MFFVYCWGPHGLTSIQSDELDYPPGRNTVRYTAAWGGNILSTASLPPSLAVRVLVPQPLSNICQVAPKGSKFKPEVLPNGILKPTAAPEANEVQ